MNTSYAVPTSVEEACRLLEFPGAHALAGGVAFTMALTKGEVNPGLIVSLAKIRELRGISAEQGLRIGALATHGELLRNPAVAEYEPLLPQMFSDVGNVRVRAMGTLGGNLAYADPRHDPAPLLSALGASVVLESVSGVRRVAVETLAVTSFKTVVAAGELLTAIELPARPSNSHCGWTKLQTSSLDDYATVSVALAYEQAGGRVRNARIFVGASDSHVRPLHASHCLEGAAIGVDGTISPEALEAAAAALQAQILPRDDHRGSTDYKRKLVRVALLRAAAGAQNGRCRR